MIRATMERGFLSTADAMQAFNFPRDEKEKRKAKRYLKNRTRTRLKRAEVIVKAKKELGQHSSTLHEATELWLVNDALVALRDEYSLSTDQLGRKIHLRALRYIERLKKYN